MIYKMGHFLQHPLALSIEPKMHRFIKKYALDKNGEETVVMGKNDPSFKNSKIDQI